MLYHHLAAERVPTWARMALGNILLADQVGEQSKGLITIAQRELLCVLRARLRIVRSGGRALVERRSFATPVAFVMPVRAPKRTRNVM